MVVINRRRKDSYENAHELLPLIDSHGVQAQQTPVVNWDNHALRLNGPNSVK